jgi:hypothetical protein
MDDAPGEHAIGVGGESAERDPQPVAGERAAR